MSKENKKISLIGSNENVNISIVIDESSKKINILKENVNTIFRETFYLGSLRIDDKESEIKMELKDDNLSIKNKNNSGVTIDADGNIKIQQIDKKETKDNTQEYHPYASFDKYEL
ncbi:hypothetical protein [Anaerococcus vaginimassiliensis]|uniref:hypothetical protein n=1 Tax=Anaerococcus vaginimassiliensis TaxID=2042308 RepID=UPI00102FBBFF|nr:hypothetical protein [Anaerococcus vaginimassiliensis]